MLGVSVAVKVHPDNSLCDFYGDTVVFDLEEEDKTWLADPCPKTLWWSACLFKPTNKVTFIDKNFQIEPMDLKSKEAVALDIINKIIQHYDA